MDNWENIKFSHLIRLYFEKFFFVEEFMRNNLTFRNGKENNDSKFARDLLKNTCKCIMISHILFLANQFSKGKQFYLVYLKTSFKATLFGFCYSVYFNDKKLEVYTAKKRMSFQPLGK